MFAASSMDGGYGTIDKEEVLWIVRELQLELSTSKPVFFHGRSMLPLLRDGDYLEILRVNTGDIRVGDIVTYRDTDEFPTRRVIGIDADLGQFRIQADHKPARVFRVPAAEILGRVEARVRDGRRLHRESLRWRWTAWKLPLRKRTRRIWRRFLKRRLS